MAPPSNAAANDHRVLPSPGAGAVDSGLQANPPTGRAGGHRRLDPAPGVCLLLLAGGCWLAHVLGVRMEEAVVRKEAERFASESVRWKAFLEAQLGSHVQVLQTLRDWFSLQQPMTEPLWTNYFFSLNAAVYYPAFTAFGFAAHTREDRLAEYLAEARKRLGADYAIRSTLPGTTSGYSWYSMVVDRFHRNLQRDALQPPFLDYGQDLNQVPDLWAAMNWALGLDRHGVGVSLSLRSGSNRVSGVPIFLPVYREPLDHAGRQSLTPNILTQTMALGGNAVDETGRVLYSLGHLRGLVFGLVDLPRLFAKHVPAFPPDFSLRLTVSDVQAQAHLIFDGGARRADRPVHHHVGQLRHGGRDWVLETAAGPGFDSMSSRKAYWLTAGSGWAVSVLITGFLAAQIRGRREQERTAEALAEARDTLHELLAERQRLGRDLHDKTMQSIYSTRLALSLCRERLAGGQPRLGELLADCEHTLERCIQELREFIQAREPEPETVVSFADALRGMADHLQPLFPGEIHVEIDEAVADVLSAPQAAELLCIAREAMSNSLRHGQAGRIVLRLQAEGPEALLHLRDDGSGFEPAQARAGGMGLRNIAARAKSLGGRLRIKSRPSEGTTVEVRVPVGAPQPGPSPAVKVETGGFD